MLKIAAIYPDDTFGKGVPRQLAVVGPEGFHISLDSLPPPDTKRWVARRKAEIVAAVRGGLLSLNDACRRYRLTQEEFRGWNDAVHEQGLKGPMATRRGSRKSGEMIPPLEGAPPFDV